MKGISKDIENLSAEQRARLEARLTKKRGVAAEEQTISRRPDRDTLPLSFAQQRLWFLDQFEPGTSIYAIPSVTRIRGPLDTGLLERCLNEIVRRHEVLRTTFPSQDGEPVQAIAPFAPFSVPVVNLSELSDGEWEAEGQRRAREEAHCSFDLAHGPLLRATLLEHGDAEHILLLTIHHIVYDGWSVGLLFRELRALYQAFAADLPSPLPDLPVQYGDYAAWQREWLQGEVLERQLAYWKQQLAAVPGMELPTDRPRRNERSHSGGHRQLTLSAETVAGLRRLCREERATSFMALLAAFQVLLSRHTGQDEITVGTPIAGRNRAEIEALIGCFLNTLVIRTDLSGDPSFREVLQDVRGTTLEAYDHEGIPFEKLLDELQVERDVGRTPLFQVFFNMMQLGGEPLRFSGLAFEQLPPSDVGAKFELTLYIHEWPEGISVSAVYDTDLFSAERIAEMLAQYRELLEQIVAKPDSRIAELPLVTESPCAPDPRQPLDSSWQGAVHELFVQHAADHPDRPAVIDEHEHWTYGELDRGANRLAHYLRGGGVGRGDVVAVFGQRAASLVCAVLGVLKAGAAFLILDPAYPTTRLLDCVAAAAPRGFLRLEGAGPAPAAVEHAVEETSAAAPLALPAGKAALLEVLDEYPEHDPAVEVGPDDLAYIAFTSGTASKPKGLMGRHGPLSHFTPWQRETFGLDENDRYSMLSGLSHDPLQRDMFTALMTGGAICIPDPDEIASPGWLAGWMRRERVTVAHLTPAMGQILTGEFAGQDDDGDRTVPSLRCAFFVGDKLTWNDVDRLRRLAPGVTCVNLYGSIETQRAVGQHVVRPEDRRTAEGRASGAAKEVLPLGRGIPDVQLLVLNAAGGLCGPVEVGEVHVRSPHLAQGYLGDEALTRGRFIVNPFTGDPADRLYKTGDLGRYREDGNVEFLGRNDLQIKVRGFRIEPGEIESLLARHAKVNQAVVVAYGEDDNRRLVCYFTVAGAVAPTISDLRRFLSAALPQHLIPADFVLLEEMPVTPNGKLDRRALPDPGGRTLEPTDQYVAPRNELERTIADVWAEVLGVERVGVHDNYFELGGHSLAATRLVARLRQALDLDLSLRILFEEPTVAGLAGGIGFDEERRASGYQEHAPRLKSLVQMQPRGSRPPLFLVCGGRREEDLFRYLSHMVKHLGLDQPICSFVVRGLDGRAAPHTTVESMARDYLAEVRDFQPHGPYLLSGECVGGVVAYEMAQLLRQQGETVGLLALMDTTRPTRARECIVGVERLALRTRRVKQHLRHAWGLGLRKGLEHLSGLGRRRRKLLVPMSEEERRQSCIRSVEVNYPRILRRYRPKPYPGKLTLLVNEETQAHRPNLGWRDMAQLETHVLPGNHLTRLTLHGKTTADQLQVVIDRACREQCPATEPSP